MILHRLQQRAAIIQAARCFFINHHYLEVETPLRLPALIPEANIQPEPSTTWFLQTSPELCMKRLLAAGASRIFQICKCFRNSERGSRHLPEFTMLEWYRLAGDYQDLMTETQAFVQGVAGSLAKDDSYDHDLVSLLMQSEWQKITVREAFRRYAPLSAATALADGCFDEILVDHVEPFLGRERPCFLYDYPTELGSLAKTSLRDPEVAERFELYIQGVELANGFSELTDPVEQRQRFAKEAERGRAQGNVFGELPEKFLEDLGAIDTACGIAFGMDRLIMLLTGATSIDEVVSFVPEDL